MTHSLRRGGDDTPRTRQEQKARTRQALLDAALELTEQQSLGSLGLREITRAVGIAPTAFYRHFPDVDSLGVALVEQSLVRLRTMIRAVRDGMSYSEDVINASVDVMARQVREHRDHFRFIVRERLGGVPRVREAIAEQIGMFSTELAADLAADKLMGAPAYDIWPPADLRMLTDLIVNHMFWTVAALLDPRPAGPDAERHVLDTAARQLRLIMLGARQWPACDTTLAPDGTAGVRAAGLPGQ